MNRSQVIEGAELEQYRQVNLGGVIYLVSEKDAQAICASELPELKTAYRVADRSALQITSPHTLKIIFQSVCRQRTQRIQKQ